MNQLSKIEKEALVEKMKTEHQLEPIELLFENKGKKINFKSWECEEVPGWSVKSANDMSGEMRVSMELVEYKK